MGEHGVVVTRCDGQHHRSQSVSFRRWQPPQGHHLTFEERPRQDEDDDADVVGGEVPPAAALDPGKRHHGGTEADPAQGREDAAPCLETTNALAPLPMLLEVLRVEGLVLLPVKASNSTPIRTATCVRMMMMMMMMISPSLPSTHNNEKLTSACAVT